MRRLSIGRLIGIAFLATVVTLLSFDTTQACWLWGRLRHRCPPVVCAPVRVAHRDNVLSGSGGLRMLHLHVPSSVVYELPTCSPCPTAAAPSSVARQSLAKRSSPIVVRWRPVANRLWSRIPWNRHRVRTKHRRSWNPRRRSKNRHRLWRKLTPVDVPEPPAEDDRRAFWTNRSFCRPSTKSRSWTQTLPAEEAMEATEPAPLEDDLDIFGEEPAADAVTPPADTAPATRQLPRRYLFGSGDRCRCSCTRRSFPADVPSEEGADALDDLFGDASDAGTPAAAAAEEPMADDLFGDLDAATPTETPAVDEPAADDLLPLDELPADDAAPVESRMIWMTCSANARTKARTKKSLLLPSVASRPASAMSFRIWTDNTGNYQTVGQLVQVSDSHVRLLKDNGRFSTVPRTRLSQADLAYVDQMVKLLGLQITSQLAAR